MVRTLAPPAALPRQKRRRARRSDPRRSPFARLTPDESRTVRALLAAGALSPDGLQRAEDVFKATGGRLEQILVNHGLVSRLVLGRVRAEEFGLDFVDLPHAIVDAALAAECDPHALIDARIFPLRRAGDVLHVATCVEPELAQDEAHRLFGPGQVSLQVTTDWDVSWAVQKHC